ncbi:MAG: hypothetical protein ABFD89_13435 [Bryobacteraceae bacterium]
MCRSVAIVACLVVLAVAAPATTLERLTLDEMTAKSTAIVRGTVLSSYGEARGRIIYTHFKVQVSELWKGTSGEQLDVVIPGGTADGLRQTFTGTPKLTTGGDYVLFLWTGKTGLTHIIGLTQGVFSVASDGKGTLMATRRATLETMLDRKTGQVIEDETLRLRLTDLRSRVNTVLLQPK